MTAAAGAHPAIDPGCHGFHSNDLEPGNGNSSLSHILEHDRLVLLSLLVTLPALLHTALSSIVGLVAMGVNLWRLMMECGAAFLVTAFVAMGCRPNGH